LSNDFYVLYNTNNAGAVTLAGAISGGGSLNTGGPSTLTVLSNGGNSYSGGTVVNGGTLDIINTGTLPAGRDVIVQAGTLNLNRFSYSIGSLTLSDPGMTAASPAPVVRNTGGGTLVLGGNVTYNPGFAAPAASIAGGTLDLGGRPAPSTSAPGGAFTTR